MVKKESDALLYLVRFFDYDLLTQIEKFDFDLIVHQLLFDIILKFELKYKVCPKPDFILEELRRNIQSPLSSIEVSHLVTFFERWSSLAWNESDRPYLKDKVREWLKRRRAVRLLRYVDSMLARDDVDRIPQAVKKLVLPSKGSASIVDHAVTLENRVNIWQKIQSQIGVLSPMTLGQLDMILPGEVAAICAPPKVGKTFLLVWVGAHAVVASRARVLHFTLEMTAEEVGLRYDLTFVNQYGAQSISMDTYGKHREIISRCVNHFLQPPASLLQVDVSSYSATPSLLEAQFDQACSLIDGHPDLVILDYLNLVHSENIRDRSKLFAVGADVVEWLHSFAKDKQVAIWTVTQASREGIKAQEGAKNRVKASSIGQSYAFLYGFDHVITVTDLARQRAKDQEVRSRTLLDVSLVYSRRCPPFYGLQVEIDYPYSRFFNPPRSTDLVYGNNEQTPDVYKEVTGIIPKKHNYDGRN